MSDENEDVNPMAMLGRLIADSKERHEELKNEAEFAMEQSNRKWVSMMEDHADLRVIDLVNVCALSVNLENVPTPGGEPAVDLLAAMMSLDMKLVALEGSLKMHGEPSPTFLKIYAGMDILLERYSEIVRLAREAEGMEESEPSAQ